MIDLSMKALNNCIYTNYILKIGNIKICKHDMLETLNGFIHVHLLDTKYADGLGFNICLNSCCTYQTRRPDVLHYKVII